MASLHLQHRNYDDALNCLKYIFDWTDPNGNYWRTLPISTAQDRSVDDILKQVAVDQQLGMPNADVAAIRDWQANPFDPHRIARARPRAYGIKVLMDVLDVLIADGDNNLATNTQEGSTSATQLYMLASMLLGPRPERVRMPPEYQSAGAQSFTYADIESGLDAFSNVLVDLENVLPPQVVNQQQKGPTQGPLPTIAVGILLFCIPPNEKLLSIGHSGLPIVQGQALYEPGGRRPATAALCAAD